MFIFSLPGFEVAPFQQLKTVKAVTIAVYHLWGGPTRCYKLLGHFGTDVILNSLEIDQEMFL